VTIAFFGTPDIAATCLQATHDAALALGRRVSVVVSQPDRKRGRGQQEEPTPTKTLATSLGIATLQPQTLKKGTADGDAFFAAFSAMHIDLAVVVAYGRILPTRVLQLPPCGFVNVHASLLPRWRGAAPIQRAIEAGDVETGVCLMDMTAGLDEGDVRALLKTRIHDDDTGESLTLRLATLGGALLTTHLDALLKRSLPRTPQPVDGVTYAKMLSKEEGLLRFDQPAAAVSAQARAMTPWPGAYTMWRGEPLKLFVPRVVAGRGAAGTVIDVDDGLTVACADASVRFTDAQLPNKKRMRVVDLLRGQPLERGTRLG
jgi:methionyl-tRNA formyltransferase